MKKIDNRYVRLIFETNTEFAEWFGYYNYDVINTDGTKLLCNRANFDGRAITANDWIELGYYELGNGEWHHIAYTDSFNWQQGAMLQWMPGKGNETKVIFNCSDKKHFYSVIHDIESGKEERICFPVYCVTPDGKQSITLNYERNYWCRAYHYQSVRNPEYDVRVAEDDGVFAVDLTTGEVKRIVAIQDVITCGHDDVFDTARHWLEHIMISPDGEKFVFLHRFSFGNGYRTRIFIANIDGTDLQEIVGWKNKEWSHFGWKGSHEFAVYTVDNGEFAVKYTQDVMLEVKSSFSLKSFVRDVARTILPQNVKDLIIGRKKYYQHYKVKEGKFELVDTYGGKLLNIDGHPSFTADGKYMITDSYPDTKGRRRLIIYNTENNKGVLVGLFNAPLRKTLASCDLHPKLSFQGKYVVVDTAYSGRHRMVVMQIRWDNVIKALE